MTNDRRRELISRHLSGAGTLDGEIALLLAQSPDKQEVVEHRLEAIDRYLSLSEPSVSDVDAAAARVGVSRRQFYRLLVKLRALGPVRALVPGFQNVPRDSAVREGLAEPIEAVLIKALLREPDARISTVQGLVTARCEELGLTPPSEWMLRQRVHSLRVDGTIDPEALFGSQVVVDQVSLDLPIRDVSGLPRFAILTAIIDRSTRIVLGSSILPRDGFGMGLAEAVRDLRTTGLPAFKRERFPVARNASALTWVVPPGLESLAETLKPSMSTSQLQATWIDSGPRRHGDLILRLLGDRLGPYAIRARSSLGIDGGRPEGPGEDIGDARAIAGYCIEAWNRKLIARLPVVDQADLPKRARRLDRIVQRIVTWFTPLTERIDAAGG